MAWIIRCLLFIAAPVTALFVSRDALNFGVINVLVAIALGIGCAVIAELWLLRRRQRTTDVPASPRTRP